MTYEYDKYISTIDTVKETLDKYGVAIIRKVLSSKECKQMYSGMWDYFEHITKSFDTPINRSDINTWKEIYKLFPSHGMLIQHWNCGHSQACWDVRQNKKIIDVFSKIWDCNNKDLLVSFDGLSFAMPHEVTNRGYNRNNTWYHSDQSFTRNGFECVQSWVSALDTNEDDATLGFMEGSHKFHKKCAEKFKITERKDWLKLDREQEDFYVENGCQYKKIKCPKGSLVLWDSRTIHCGVEANKNRKNMNHRAIIYLCYMPRSQCSEKLLKKKQTAFNDMRMTSHWPCKVTLFPKNPRTYGSELPNITMIQKPVLNDAGLRLAGF